MDKITISFQYDKNEYIKAFREYLFLSKIIRKPDLAVVGLLSAVEIILLLWNGFSFYSIVIGSIIIFYLILFLLLYFYQPLNVYLHTPKLHTQYKLTFTNDNIKFKTNDVSSEINWNIYSKVLHCKDFIYLIQSKNIYTILPKRAFHGENDLKAFDRIIKSKNNIVYKNSYK
jgi:hypothetical protein